MQQKECRNYAASGVSQTPNGYIEEVRRKIKRRNDKKFVLDVAMNVLFKMMNVDSIKDYREPFIRQKAERGAEKKKKEYLKSVGVSNIMNIPNNMMFDYIERSNAKLDIIMNEDKVYRRYIKSDNKVMNDAKEIQRRS